MASILDILLGSAQTGQGLVSPKNLQEGLMGAPTTPAQPITLDPITVRGPAPQPQQQPQIPASVPMPQQQGNNGFMQMLGKIISNPEVLKALPTLAATGIGLGVPGALPGAAGFAQGYEGERARQREAKDEGRAVYVLDQKTGALKPVGKVGSKDIVRNKETGGFNLNLGQGFEQLAKDLNIDLPEVEKINQVVVEKDGEQFELPEDQLSDAIKQGYKQVQ